MGLQWVATKKRESCSGRGLNHEAEVFTGGQLFGDVSEDSSLIWHAVSRCTAFHLSDALLQLRLHVFPREAVCDSTVCIAVFSIDT